MQLGEVKKNSKRAGLIIAIGFGLVILLVSVAIAALNAGLINITSLNLPGNDVAQIESQVRSMIILNPEEKPTIASILDIDKVRSQNPEFYANARNGDYLIVFSDKAIIYRAQQRIIVNVFPILSTENSTN